VRRLDLDFSAVFLPGMAAYAVSIFKHLSGFAGGIPGGPFFAAD
jgi:hypothetical protein